ncbi:MAG TPA: BF3164 family lipoprotein [Longimicrobium sp.]|nr:BF3164 family lipoprotein [Longimicrobium sp.]
MYRRLPIHVLVAAALSLAACAGGDAESPSTPVLSGEVIATGDYLDQPGQLAVVGERLVVLDRSAPKVHVFGARDGKRLVSFGRNGDGPGEFRSARHVQPTGDPGQVWIYDMSLRRMTRLRFGAEAVPQVEEVVNLDAGGGVFLHPVWLTDTSMVVSGIFPRHADGRLLLARRDGGVIRMLGEAPRHPGGAAVPTSVLQHAYEGPVSVKPDRSRFAIATRQGDRLEIFGAGGERIAQVTGSTGFLPIFEVRQREAGVSMAVGGDLRVGYVDLASTDDRIYALFSGQLIKDAGSTSYYGREVHVFDWSGRQLHRLPLDEPAFSMAVDPTGTRLYAIRHDPTPSVVRYEIPPAARGG